MEGKNLSDFIKYAYKKNKVKDVTEAFDEYPPEKEWHKGKIENVLNEPESKYNCYNIGDIVFVKKYYYNNGEEGNNHLFIIVDINYIAVPIESFGMLLSSNIEKQSYKSNVLLKKDIKNGLKKDSIVKTDAIYLLKESQILFKIGTVDKKIVEEYKKMFVDFNK